MSWLDREIVCLGFLGSEDQAGGLATFREKRNNIRVWNIVVYEYCIQQGWINWDRNEKM